jgi:hypothetical protein
LFKVRDFVEQSLREADYQWQFLTRGVAEATPRESFLPKLGLFLVSTVIGPSLALEKISSCMDADTG